MSNFQVVKAITKGKVGVVRSNDVFRILALISSNL